MQKNLAFDDVLKAHQRIKNYIKNTRVISNQKLNEELGCEVFLKMENGQKANSFKARGAFSAILSYQEKFKKLPEKIVAHSSGNHAQAVAYACKILKIPAVIYMAANASPFKIAATREHGAEVVICERRKDADQQAIAKQREGYFFIHPSDNDDVISGQGTAALEALSEIGEVTAIFAPCGGGGLAAGCYLASLNQKNKPQIFACEPLNANDAAISVREGKIFRFEDSPNTVADGARTLAVSERCLNYLKKLTGILEITEEEIIFWQKKLSTILDEKIEPTSALAIAGLERFIKNNPSAKGKKFLVIISGGNLEG